MYSPLENRRVFVAAREGHGMDNASDADLKQLVEDPEDAPLVEAAVEESNEKAAPPASP